MNDLIAINNEQRMTSLQIAEVVGKNHSDVMRAIRNMEPAWEKVSRCKFALAEYSDHQGKPRPMYSLNKTECLYIATKFNDEARAKLILRWEELEKMRMDFMSEVPQSFSQALLLAAKQAERIERQQMQIESQQKEMLCLANTITSMEKKVTYLDIIFQSTNTVKTTTIAQDYGMSAKAFNKLLHSLGVQHKVGDVWVLYAKYLPEGYVKDVTYTYKDKQGREQTRCNTQWTQKGRTFLYDFLKEHKILPMIEQ